MIVGHATAASAPSSTSTAAAGLSDDSDTDSEAEGFATSMAARITHAPPRYDTDVDHERKIDYASEIYAVNVRDQGI